MTILSPADAIEVGKMVPCLMDWKGPVYLRINRNDLPFVTPEGEPYHIGKIWKLREGADAAVFASGVMVSKALEAAEALAREGRSVRVLNVSTIKPLDVEAVIPHASGVRAIVVAEEASVIGGLGAAVVEALRGVRHALVEFVGVRDSFGVSAENYEILLRHYGLTAAAVAEAVLSTLYDIISTAGQTLDLRVSLESVMQKIIKTTGFTGGLITIFNEARNKLERAVRVGMPGQSPADPAEGLDGSLCE